MSLEGCANSRGILSLPGGRGIDAAKARAKVMHCHWGKASLLWPWSRNSQRSGRANPCTSPSAWYFCSQVVPVPCSILTAKSTFFVELYHSFSCKFIRLTEGEWNATALGRTGKRWHLHTVVLCALPVATAHVYAAIPNVDVIDCPRLLLVKRSRLVPAETSRLRPWERKKNRILYFLTKVIFVLTERKCYSWGQAALGRFVWYQHDPGLVSDNDNIPSRKECPHFENRTKHGCMVSSWECGR